MSTNLKPIFITLLFLLIGFKPVQSQSIVGEWENYTSILDFRDIIQNQNYILGATSGGLVKFDLDEKKFNIYGLKDGLSKIDLNSLKIDKNGKLWICSGAPVGEINIWDIENEEVIKVFDQNVWDENLTSFSSIDFYQNKAFAACQWNMDWGIFEFDCTDEYHYKDFYFNFPVNITNINSVKIINDSLWLCTNSGLFVTNPDRNDLKAPEAWNLISGSQGKIVSDIIDFNGQIITNLNSKLYRIHKLKSEEYNSTFNFDIYNLATSDELGLLIATNKGIFSILDNTIKNNLKGNFTNVISNDNGFIGIKYKRGLFHFDGQNENNYIPNSMLSNINTALCIDNENRLITASNEGFSTLTSNGWKNIVKGNFVNITSDVNNNYNYFIADTIDYNVSSRVFSLLQRHNGDLLASLYGSTIQNGEKGGILKFNPDNLENYETFDTTNGAIGTTDGYYLTPEIMKMDSHDNIWVAIHETMNKRPISILTKDNEWEYFSIDESNGHLSTIPTTIAFDNMGRVWIGGETSSGSIISKGGIAVLDYNNTLSDKTDDEWYYISTSDGLANPNVYSLVFDDNNILWIMTSEGIQKAEISANFPNTYFSLIDDKPFFSNLSFSKECVIKVDGRNNKWITTANSGGVKVYTNDDTWLNNYVGFTTENSGLLSNDVLDIVFFESDGRVVLSTTKGISVYKSPYANTGKKFKELKIFPMPFIIPSNQPLVIDGLLPQSEVKIITLDGTFVKHLNTKNETVNGVQAFWDGRDSDNNLVSSGVYLCMVFSKNGESTVGKIAVIHK